MKTASYLRISVVLVTMTAIACSDPIEEKTKTRQNPTEYIKFPTSVTTWVQKDFREFTGLITQTPDTDLSKVQVYIVSNGTATPVSNQKGSSGVSYSPYSQSEYFWFTYENNVLLLNYVGSTAASTPPFPLELVILY